jgi:hypothetical protein
VLENIIPQNGINNTISIKIKLEVDKFPPLKFETEEKILLQPFSFYVKCFTLPNLFAGKMHALLFRKWGTNVKGRDWYDMEWYIKKGVTLNINHFLVRAIESGDWNEEKISGQEFITLLHEKINTVNIIRVKADISRFIANTDVLDLWSVKYFIDLTANLKIK